MSRVIDATPLARRKVGVKGEYEAKVETTTSVDRYPMFPHKCGVWVSTPPTRPTGTGLEGSPLTGNTRFAPGTNPTDAKDGGFGRASALYWVEDDKVGLP